ncbi:MAG: radical SAM protein [Candidatus Aenigmatarchaeota archaeon]
MEILLVMPKNPVFAGSNTLPVGMAYLASSLEKEGHEVECLDFRVEQNKNMRNVVKDFDLIGISSCTPSIREAWKLASIAKRYGKPVVLGGPHPSALPIESLKNKSVDIIVRGEGEETFKEICNGKKKKDILGISYKKGKRIVHNPNRPFIKDLDSLPFPARHLFKFREYRSEFHRHNVVGDILTSRGCPFNCNFCYKAVFGRQYRVRSAKNVVREWKDIINMGYEEIGIIDDNFSVDQKRAIDICNMITKQKLNVDWTATNGLRVDSVSADLFKAMKKSGCYRIALGVESGSQYILDKIGKCTNLKLIRNAVKLAKKFNFETYLFFMIGNLYETEETVRKTIEFAKELEGDYTQFTVATPYPGTRMYDIIKKEGEFLVNDWEKFGSYENRAYFEHGGINAGFVEKMYKKAYREYYLRPRIMWKYLKKHNFGILKGLRFLK